MANQAQVEIEPCGVFRDNDRACRFYELAGWARTGEERPEERLMEEDIVRWERKYRIDLSKV